MIKSCAFAKALVEVATFPPSALSFGEAWICCDNRTSMRRLIARHFGCCWTKRSTGPFAAGAEMRARLPAAGHDDDVWTVVFAAAAVDDLRFDRTAPDREAYRWLGEGPGGHPARCRRSRRCSPRRRVGRASRFVAEHVAACCRDCATCLWKVPSTGSQWTNRRARSKSWPCFSAGRIISAG